MLTPARIVLSRAASSIILVLTVCGCSASGTVAPEPTEPKASATPSTSAATSAAPTPSAEGALILGDSFTNRFSSPDQGDIEVLVAVSNYIHSTRADRTPYELGAGTPDDAWDALEVKVCAVKGNITANTNTWKLEAEDGTRYDATFITGGPKPEFVNDSSLRPGDCVIGNIMFVVPQDIRPVKALYAPPSLDKPQEWELHS
ncbi:DUF4352 domain-containing protein [Streptomyces sp. NPDC057565]|uniref:DUF4352 domain-containing protein n=1 Tax=Streptomyces sp. NPDC057565 TaxID=3346169 RepID=UPI0036A66765